MGAEENAAIIRRGYEAFNAGDMETLTELFDENASWHTPGKSPIAGDHEGRDAAFAQFGRYGGETGGTFKAELQHLLEDDDNRVVGVSSQHRGANRKEAGRRLRPRLRARGRPAGRRSGYFFDVYASGRVLVVAKLNVHGVVQKQPHIVRCSAGW